MITCREEEWPMRVTILENTLTDAKSNQLLPKKKEKALPRTFLQIIGIIGLSAQLKGFAVPSQDFLPFVVFSLCAQPKATQDFFFDP